MRALLRGPNGILKRTASGMLAQSTDTCNSVCCQNNPPPGCCPTACGTIFDICVEACKWSLTHTTDESRGEALTECNTPHRGLVVFEEAVDLLVAPVSGSSHSASCTVDVTVPLRHSQKTTLPASWLSCFAGATNCNALMEGCAGIRFVCTNVTAEGRTTAPPAGFDFQPFLLGRRGDARCFPGPTVGFGGVAPAQLASDWLALDSGVYVSNYTGVYSCFGGFATQVEVTYNVTVSHSWSMRPSDNHTFVFSLESNVRVVTTLASPAECTGPSTGDSRGFYGATSVFKQTAKYRFMPRTPCEGQEPSTFVCNEPAHDCQSRVQYIEGEKCLGSETPNFRAFYLKDNVKACRIKQLRGICFKFAPTNPIVPITAIPINSVVVDGEVIDSNSAGPYSCCECVPTCNNVPLSDENSSSCWRGPGTFVTPNARCCCNLGDVWYLTEAVSTLENIGNYTSRVELARTASHSRNGCTNAYFRQYINNELSGQEFPLQICDFPCAWGRTNTLIYDFGPVPFLSVFFQDGRIYPGYCPNNPPPGDARIETYRLSISCTTFSFDFRGVVTLAGTGPNGPAALVITAKLRWSIQQAVDERCPNGCGNPPSKLNPLLPVNPTPLTGDDIGFAGIFGKNGRGLVR